MRDSRGQVSGQDRDLLRSKPNDRVTKINISLERDRKHHMSDMEKPEFAKQSFKGFLMRIMMMIDLFKKKSDD